MLFVPKFRMRLICLSHYQPISLCNTTLQSKMNAKLSPHRFWPCHENGLIKTIQIIPPQPICECQVDFHLLWMKAYPGLS